MAPPQPIRNRCTYADYAAMTDDMRWELDGGELIAMSPGPSDAHQDILGELYIVVRTSLGKGGCAGRLAYYDVILDAPERGRWDAEYTYQPDLSVICDRSKIKPHGCEAAPDLVIEVISPSTAARDYVQKLRAYERFGVVEYWIVDPDGQRLHVFRRDEDDRLDLVMSLGPADVAESAAVDGLKVELGEVFGEAESP